MLVHKQLLCIVLEAYVWCRPELMKVRVMELNASDERGISVVRDKIKAFAATAVGYPVPGYPCPPYKLLILDEADAMTQVGCRTNHTAENSRCELLIVHNYVRHTVINVYNTSLKPSQLACYGGTSWFDTMAFAC